MAGREHPREIGRRRGDRLERQVAQTGMDARLNAGLSRRVVATGLDISESKLARWERLTGPRPTIAETAEWMRVLGLDLVVNTYPSGGALRDGAHAELINLYIALVHAAVPRFIEYVLPGDRDRRAFDVVNVFGSVRVGVAAETRLRDWQELLRREHLKMRDGGVDHLLLVLYDTHANRQAVRLAGPALREALPLDGRPLRRALREGRDPGGSGILFLRRPPRDER